MWINDLKARFSKSSERKIEELAPAEPQEPQVEEPEPIPVAMEVLTDPSQVKVPSVWQGMGLEQAIYDAHLAASLAEKEFTKVAAQTSLFTCPCGMSFNFREMYDEHRYYSHNTQNHEVEIVRQNTERRDALLSRRGYR